MRNHFSSSFIVAAALLGGSLAAAQQPPGNAVGAIPGMAQPQFDQWQLRAQQDEELYIPPSADRPLDPTAGPRIQVTTIDVDIDPSLELQIDAETANRLNLMINTRVADNLATGFTIGGLEELAADLTDTIRDSGFILAWAYLPEQDVENNTVTITVLAGSLDAVTADGNNRYSTERLIQPFSDLVGAPVQRTSIENSIMAVRNYPGLSTSAVFSPGDEVGTSQLTLRVSEDPIDFSVRADNHGTESTGENRVRSDIYWYNPFGFGDFLTVNALQTFNPAENLYGGITYQAPLFRHDWSLILSYSHNAFEVAEGLAAGAGEDGKNLAGDTDVGSIGISKNLRMTRRSRLDAGVDMSVKNAVLENLPTETEDNLTIASLFMTGEMVDGFGAGGINQFEIRYSQGIPDLFGSMSENGDGGQSTRTGGTGISAGGDFSKFNIRYQRLQRISERNSLLFRAEGQVSDDLLVSLEQFILGGPNNVRAYPIAEYLADQGGFASLEWIIDAGKLDSNASFSISLFGDYAYGKNNDPLANEIDDTDLAGYGLGLSFAHTSDSGNQFQFRVDVATPATDIEPSDEDDPQIYGQISYTFR